MNQISFFFFLLFLQSFQPFHQPFERAFGSFGGRGIREADPVIAEGREERAGDDGDAMILGKILSEWFAIRPAFGLDEFTDIDEGVISLADDVLELMLHQQVPQYDAAGVGRLDDGLCRFVESHFVRRHGNS